MTRPTIVRPVLKPIGACKMMMVYDAILEGDEATEANALDYARGMVWDEVEVSEQEIKYSQFIDTVNGIDVYYDYGADYYFFADAN